MLLISDSNILIDISTGGLLERMFSLPEGVGTPDILFAEELSTHHPELIDLGLKLITVDGAGVAEAYQLLSQCTGSRAPSSNDLLALMLAKQEQCPLLTGDRRLKDLACEHYPDIEVRGTLWLVERLVICRIISSDEAVQAYEKMIDDGSRLPAVEIRMQLKRLRETESH